MKTTNERMENRPLVVPSVDVREDGDGYTIQVALPGVAEDAVHLTIEDRTLLLEADNDVAVPEGYTVVRREIPELRYRAVFELPDRVDAGAIRSQIKNGMLSVVLPKREEVKPRRIAVTAGS